MSGELSSEEHIRLLEAKYGERRQTEFRDESEVVTCYFQAISKRLSATYTFEKVLAVGGTGFVHVGHHNRFRQPIVLKINRPNVEPEGVSMVEHEAQVLPQLSHPNIIRVLDLGQLPDRKPGEEAQAEEDTWSEYDSCRDLKVPKLTYIVEPFITGSKPFFTIDKERISETWLYGRVAELKRAMPEALDLPRGDETGKATGLIEPELCTDSA